MKDAIRAKRNNLQNLALEKSRTFFALAILWGQEVRSPSGKKVQNANSDI